MSRDQRDWVIGLEQRIANDRSALVDELRLKEDNSYKIEAYWIF